MDSSVYLSVTLEATRPGGLSSPARTVSVGNSCCIGVGKYLQFFITLTYLWISIPNYLHLFINLSL